MNFECVKRQSFGARYERTSKDKVLAQRLLDGRLSMSPHPEWQLPSEPDWLENPFTDDNWQFQYHSLRWLDPLRREAMAGSDQALLTWERYVQSWISANPPGSSPTKWAWIDMGDALRTYELAFAIGLYTEPPSWLVESLAQHIQWLADEKNLGHGNHALHQHQALFVAASIMEESELVALAIDRMGRMIVESYDPQGMNEEGSISYQEANYRWWNEALHRLKLEDIPTPEWANLLDSTPESLAHATQPNGKYVRIGDMDSGSPAKIDSPFTDYVTSSGAKGIAPQDLIKVYSRGYIYGRSGWGETERDFAQETFFSLCFGNQKKIHGQVDGGSLTYFANGRPWLIDTGKFMYGSHPMRSYVVNRPGHNLLMVKGIKYNRTVEVTLFRNAESNRHFEAMTRDTGYEGVLITRRTIFSKRGEYLLVLDAVSAEEEVEIEQRWHTDESTSTTLSKMSAVIDGGTSQCEIHWIGRNGALETVYGETKPYNGWTSTGWRKNKATTVILARQKGTQLTYRTVIGARRTAEGSTSTMRRVAPGFLEYTVHGRVGTEYVLVGKKGAVISDHPFHAERVNEYFEDSSAEQPLPNVEATKLFDALIPGISSVEQRHASLDQATQEVHRSGKDSAYRSGLISSMIDIAGNDLNLPYELRDASKSRAPIISWNQQRPLKNRAGKVQSYPSRSAAAQDSTHQGIQSYRFGSLTLPVASIPGEGNTLHVSFHGALDRGKYSLPRFERGQSLASLGINQLVFADATLDLDPGLALAWFLGTETQDLHREIAEFIKERMHTLGLDHVVLSGSSGGGFAALQVSAFLPGSTVVVFNPQTSVTSYHPRLAQKATDIVFPKRDLSQHSILQRLDAAQRYRANDSKVNIHFVQNDGDSHHSIAHREPFLTAVAQLQNISVHTVTESWGPGHRSPTTEAYLHHLAEVGLHAHKETLTHERG